MVLLKSYASKETVEASDPFDDNQSYLSGEDFFSHNTYSFYDIENNMENFRLPRPSSLPKANPPSV